MADDTEAVEPSPDDEQPYAAFRGDHDAGGAVRVTSPAPVDPAQYAREAAATRVAKSAARGKPVPSWQKPDPAEPSPDDENPYAAFRVDRDTADAGLAERARLDAVNSFYRGTLAGGSRLAEMARVVTAPEDTLTDAEKQIRPAWSKEYDGIVADLARYDTLRPWGTTMEAVAGLGGTLAGGMMSPESFAGAPARGATWLARTIRAAVQQGGIQAAVDPVVQWLNREGGVQQDGWDPWRTATAAGLGAIIGGGLHGILGELVPAVAVKNLRADLAKEDPAFEGDIERRAAAEASTSEAARSRFAAELDQQVRDGLITEEEAKAKKEAAGIEPASAEEKPAAAEAPPPTAGPERYVITDPLGAKSDGETMAVQVLRDKDGSIDALVTDYGLTKVAPAYRNVSAEEAIAQTFGDHPQGAPPDLSKVARVTLEAAPAPAAAPPPAPALEDASAWTKTGGQKGSNPGGVYKDPQGVRWYVKTPKTEDHARNEMLANQLYLYAGANVPDVKLVSMNGSTAVASRILPANQKPLGKLPASTAAAQDAVDSIRRDFAADAWLANHDVIGLDRDNIMVSPDFKTIVTRIDQGGALRYRAQGQPKEGFGNAVTEIASMRDPHKAPQAAAVFKGMSDEDLVKSINRVLLVPEADIRDAVAKFGPPDKAEADKLADTLIARQNDLRQIRKSLLAKTAATAQAVPAPPAGKAPSGGAAKDFTVTWAKSGGGKPLSEANPGQPLATIVSAQGGMLMPAGAGHLPAAPPLKSAKAPKDWAKVGGQNAALKKTEPPLVTSLGKQAASGVIIREPDGRVWIVKPASGYGGYEHTFPKGKLDPDLSLQANAIKEAFEETGLKVKITGLVGDFEGDTSNTRFYWAERTGGHPKNAHWESEAVKLVPQAELFDYLNKPRDQELAKAAFGSALKPGKHGDPAAVGTPKPAPPRPGSAAALEKPAKDWLKANMANVHTAAEVDAMTADEAVDYAKQHGWQPKGAPKTGIPAAPGSHPTLPMDQASRYARATAMGFDTGKIWYHGTSFTFPAFDILKMTDEPAVFLADNPKDAKHWGGTAYPLFSRAKKIMTVDPPPGHTYQGYSHSKFKTKIAEARAQGYDGVLFKKVSDVGGIYDQFAVLHPNLLRSIHAAFDPAEVASPKLAAVKHGKKGLSPEEFARTHQELLDQAANDMVEAQERGEQIAPEAGAGATALPEPHAGVRIAAVGPHGPILEGYRDRWPEAIDWMRRASTGDLRDVLGMPDRDQRVDVIYGTSRYGLKHIDDKHPGDADALPQLWPELRVTRESDKFVELESNNAAAVIAKDYQGDPKHWLLTFFARKGTRPAEETIRSPGDSGTAAQSPPRPREEDLGALTAVGKRDEIAAAIEQAESLARTPPELQAIAQRKSGQTLAGELKRPSTGIAAPAGTAVTAPATAPGAPAAGVPGAPGAGAVAAAVSPQHQAIVRSLQQQVMDLAKALDLPVREGRVQISGALGTFNSLSGVARVREIPDLVVVAHEAGHAIEAKVGQDLTNLMQQFAHELGPMDYDYPNQVRPAEGFAEFVRHYIGAAPAYLQNNAPGFSTAFRNFMQQRAPGILQALDNAHDAYHALINASSVDAVGAVRRSRDENAEGVAGAIQRVRQDSFFPSIRMVLQRAYDWTLDRYAPVPRAMREVARDIVAREGGDLVKLKAVDNPEFRLRMLGRSQQAAVVDLMKGVQRYGDVAREGPSLRDALAHAMDDNTAWGKWDEAVRGDFSTYLIARHAEYLWRRFEAGELPNPPAAFSRADAIQAMADLEAARPRFRQASDMVHDYTRQLLRKQYEGSLIGKDLYDKLRAWEFYVPFMRDMSDKPLAGGGGAISSEGPGMTQTVKRMRGSARDIIDPLESIIAQTFLVNRTIRHNDMIRAFVNYFGRAGIAGGKFVEVLPAHEARKYEFDLGAAIEKKAVEHGTPPDHAKAMAASVADLFGEDPLMASFFRMEPTNPRGEPLVFYREGGQLKVARFMSASEGHGLYELVTAMPHGLSDLATQLLGTSAGILRSGITTNPVFMLTNFIRDQIATFFLRSDYIPFYHGIKGIISELRQDFAAEGYAVTGGVAAGAHIAPLEQAGTMTVDALKRSGYLSHRLQDLHGLLELASVSEAGTRNSVFKTVYDAKLAQGLSPNEAMWEAAYQAQDLLDFSRWGSKTEAVRALTPFFNAHIQGLDKARRAMIDPIVRRAIGGELFESDKAAYKNALMAWLKLVGAGGALGAAWAAIHQNDRHYRNAPPELIGTHFVTSYDGNLVVIPKPFELSLGITAGEYAYRRLAGEDPRAAAQFADAAWEVLKPPVPVFDNPMIKTTYELWLGKSTFPSAGRDIVPDTLKGLIPPEQYTDRTSNLAKQIGKLINVSPMKVDHAIGGYFGLWGRDAMALSNAIEEDRPVANWTDHVFLRRFIKDPTRMSDATTRFWSFMARSTGAYNQAVNTYDEYVKRRSPQAMADATNFLGTLDGPTRAFVTLKSGANEDGKAAFNADEKRLHPLQRAYDAVTILNGLRREMDKNSFAPWATGEGLKLSEENRGRVRDNVRELAEMEMYNALVIMKAPGYANQRLLDTMPTLEKIDAISPVVADEIATRYATNKIYTTKAVAEAYPQMQRALLRDGSEADLGGLAVDAKAEGYEFGGERVRRPVKRRAPIAGQGAAMH